MSEPLTHQCITPEYLSWLFCSVSAIPANKVLLQESNQLIGINMLSSDFLKSLNSYSQFPGGQMPVSAPPADAHESSQPYLFEKRNILENVPSDLATLGRCLVEHQLGQHRCTTEYQLHQRPT